MRFHSDGPAIPDILLESCDAGRVVFLCGAGVSVPSGMPDFIDLTKHVIDFFDPPVNSEIMSAFQPWLVDRSGANTPLDQIFNLLHQEYGKDEVNALVTERLGTPLEVDKVGQQHDFIKRISSTQSGIPQIVTTNFDRLFEVGNHTGDALFHVPPAFPDLTLGTTIEGITYLHGRLAEADATHHPYVLSSADFGRAYLSEGWATNFIRNLLKRYTVVLVGYKAEDPPIKYLLQGLNHDGQNDRSRLYAFDRGLPEDIEAKWRDRGVTAIAYGEHPDLWRALEAWAARADDPRQWRASVIATSQQDPKSMAPHERGQVAHVLRTVQGAKLFSEAVPAPHPEWICVLDANVRSAMPSKDYGEGAETFNPALAYGLDDDLKNISEDDHQQGVSNDNLLVWRSGDDNPSAPHRLSGNFEKLPVRLVHLITMISKSINSPVLAWWASRQNSLHPQLLQQIEWRIQGSKDLHKRARHIWSLILEHHRNPSNRQFDSSWFDLKERVTLQGWTTSVLRFFRHISTPRITILQPFHLSSSKPPTANWGDIRLSDLGQFEIKLLERHKEDLNVPDEILPQVFSILEEQLIAASGLLEDVETVYFSAPTCYPDREVNGRNHVTKAADAMELFVQLFKRMSDLSPELAKAHAITWPETDKYFFRKLKLFALAQDHVFDAADASSAVLTLDQECFWSYDVVRELLFLLADRWVDFSPEHRALITERILTGPDKPLTCTDEEYASKKDTFSARYGRYLELQGCVLSEEHSDKLTTIIEGIPDWKDEWAASTVIAQGSYSGVVGTDDSPDTVLNLPVNEIVASAKGALKRDFGSLTERRPFTGLVKINPRKALSALTLARKSGDYPKELWSSMINDFPEDTPSRLKRVFLCRLIQLPLDIIAELGHTLGRWLKQNLVAILEFDEELGWRLFDSTVDGILSGGADATKSSIGEILKRGKVTVQSRRTYGHAINGPMGMCTVALLQAVPGDAQSAGSLIPEYIKHRIERLLASAGEGSDHAASVTMLNLNWFMHVDPTWTQDFLIPLLAFDHSASEPAWNGFLHSEKNPISSLAEIIKPLLINLFPWIDGFSWERDLSKVAINWLGFMRIFQPDQTDGLSKREMRTVLRSISDDARSQFIFWLGRVGQGNENGWSKLVVPFINDAWPRERQYRTAETMRAWIGLLDDTGDCFPIVYAAVKKLLIPVETNDNRFYRFTREFNDEQLITERFPESTLDLINTITPQVLARPSNELPMILALIAESEPSLTSDSRYLRLIDLVERS